MMEEIYALHSLNFYHSHNFITQWTTHVQAINTCSLLKSPSKKSGSIKSECVDMPKVRNVDMKVEFLNAFMGH